MSSPTKSIEELDPNFKDNSGEIGEDGLRWFDVRELTLEGLGWPQESSTFCRLPDRAEGVVRDPVWELSRHSAGACVRFVTNSPVLWARWSLRNTSLAMPHMPATGVSGLDLYIRDESLSTPRWRWAALGRPQEFSENQTQLLDDQPDQAREYLMYLPLYDGVTDVRIGVSPDAELAPSLRLQSKKPICFYGTSIVHGGCASRPGMSYPALLGRRYDTSHFNLGFSGNGRAEPEVATLLAELDPAVYVLDPVPNLQPQQVTERMGNFVETLRRARPKTPIVLVGNIIYQDSWTKAVRNDRASSSNEALRAVYAELKARINDLHYLEGEELLGDDGEGTVDGAHPTDVGFMRMADALAPVLLPLL